MPTKVTLFQKTQTDKVMVWEISRKGSLLSYQWGYEGTDKPQSTTEQVKPCGAYTAEEQAEILFKRKVDERIRNGYKRSRDEAEKVTLKESFSFDPLPTSFSPAKPISAKPCEDKEDPEKRNLPNKAIRTLIDGGRFAAEKKYNGARALIVVLPDGTKKLYSRKIKLMGDNYKVFMEGVKEYAILPNSILDVEIILGDGSTNEQFRSVNAMTPNTLPARADEIYAEWLQKHPDMPISGVLHNILFYDGANVAEEPYWKRWDIIQDIVSQTAHGMLQAPLIFHKFDEAVAAMEKGNWEGLILLDLDAISEITMNGKAPRPKGCWKWKRIQQADCFIAEVLPEKGNPKLVGGFRLAQYDEDGNLVDCGKVGSGIDDEIRETGWDLVGRVVIVEYAERMPRNKVGQVCFQHPRILALRDDKTVEECICYDGE